MQELPFHQDERLTTKLDSVAKSRKNSLKMNII